MSILEDIQAQFPQFSEKEKQIATYLLRNSDTMKNINTSELARLTESSPATITRFVKKIDCESFVDLKIKINASSQHNKVQEETTESADMVYNFYLKAIENTRKMTKKSEIEEVVSWLTSADRILIFGVGSSGFTATELTHRLLRMGLNVTAITDPHFMIISSSIVTQTDLVIGISTSGETAEVLESICLAKKAGAKIVTLTSFSQSSLAKVSDCSLVSYHNTFVKSKRFINSQFSMMYLIDIMTTLLLENPDYNLKMDRTIDVITGGSDENVT